MTDLEPYFDLLGAKVRDRVTGFQGTATSLSFDLYGCVQVVITPPLDKDGKHVDGHWYDANRLEVLDAARVMPLPKYGATPATHSHGPAEKPWRKGR